MAAKSSVGNADTVEREIIARLKAAKLRLRFDKVALRLVGTLQAALASAVPEGQAVVFTVSAPIRLPGKTAAALADLLRDGAAGAEGSLIIHDNEVRTRWVRGTLNPMPRVLGFVHTIESDATVILDVAEARLLDRDGA